MQNQTKPEPLGAPMAKLVLVVAIIVCLGVLVGVISWLVEKNQPGTTQPPVISANCKEGCFLAYTAGGCTACDLANENWRCVSFEENQRINKMRQKYDQDTNGPQCALCMPEQSPVGFRCVCENGNCTKTSACENDADCSSPVGGKWFGDKYKCVNNQCRIDQPNTPDWQAYRNEKYGLEMKYPRNWKIGENPTSVSLEDTEHKIGNINIGGVIYFRFDTTFNEALNGFGFKEEDGNYFIRTSSNSWINAQEKNINGIRVIVGEPIMLIYEGSKYAEKEGKRFFFIGKNSYVVFETAFYEEYNDIFDQILSTFKFIK